MQVTLYEICVAFTRRKYMGNQPVIEIDCGLPFQCCQQEIVTDIFVSSFCIFPEPMLGA